QQAGQPGPAVLAGVRPARELHVGPPKGKKRANRAEQAAPAEPARRRGTIRAGNGDVSDAHILQPGAGQYFCRSQKTRRLGHHLFQCRLLKQGQDRPSLAVAHPCTQESTSQEVVSPVEHAASPGAALTISTTPDQRILLAKRDQVRQGGKVKAAVADSNTR